MNAKRAVSKAFGRAAGSYDAHAGLQLAVARTLLAGLSRDPLPELAVDLGAATAPLSRELQRQWPCARWLALDLSPDMLAEGVKRGRLGADFAPVAADAEALPLASGCADLLFSSFALQWCPDLASLAAELLRVLAPGGRLALCVPTAGTLAELAASWREVDDAVHVNDLHAVDHWRDALARAGFDAIDVQVTRIRQHYPDVRAISAMLKHTGAHHVDRRGPAGLTAPARLKRLMAAYEKRREAAGLPLSWEVLYLTAEKPGLQPAPEANQENRVRERL